MVLNINSDAVVAMTNTLEKLHRSALPSAIRETLNKTALDVKKRTMPESAKKTFTERSPTFFKATSKVQFAKGFDVKTMQSIVGFMPQSGAKESGGATEDLKQQEDSGTIGHRAFIPTDKARAGNSHNRRVSNKNRLAAIRKQIKDTKNSKAKTAAGRFFSTAMFAGKGGLVIGSKMNKGSRLLLRINSIVRRGGKTVINSTPLYSVKGNRAVKIKQTKFMEKASYKSAKLIERIYIVEAEKQIKRLQNK